MMSGAVFKLESFNPAPAIPPARFCADDLSASYQEGYAKGMADRAEEDLERLIEALTRLSDSLNDDEHRRARLRDEAVASLSPILSAVVDTLSSQAELQRIEAALVAELGRLAAMAAPLSCHITYGEGWADTVARCLQRSHAKGVTTAQSDTPGITLSLEGGHIEFDPRQMAHGIRALITEIGDTEQ